MPYFKTFLALCVLLRASSSAGDDRQPPQPVLLDKSSDYIALTWVRPEWASSEVLYGLWSGAVGAPSAPPSGPPLYSGPKLFFSVKGLAPDTCHEFTLRLLHGEPGGGVGGGSSDAWSAAGAALRVATRASGAVPMSALVAAAAQRRRDIGTTALAEATLDPCPLAGLAHAEYFGGSAGAVLFRGATSRVTAVGTAVSAVNCDLAQCAPRYDGTRAFAPGRVGRLKVAAGLDWELGAAPALVTRTVTLPAGAATLSFVDGETGARVTLPLPGCRAEATGGGNGGGGGGGADWRVAGCGDCILPGWRGCGRTRCAAGQFAVDSGAAAGRRVACGVWMRLW